MTEDYNVKEFERLKALGNEMFKAKNYEDAKLYYTKAIEAKEEAVAYSNRAACDLNLKQYYHALYDCNRALELDPKFCKAYYRRAIALRELSRYKLARDDFVMVLSFEPDNKTASNEVGKLNKILEQDTRMVLKAYDKPEEFRSKMPMQKFQLNNQYSGSKEYNIKA
jgi:tetratricopeptide (TPR) repeat protein